MAGMIWIDLDLAAMRGSNPGEQRFDAEGLRHVIARAEVDRLHLAQTASGERRHTFALTVAEKRRLLANGRLGLSPAGQTRGRDLGILIRC